jgi:molybdate-binding protein
MLAGCDPGISVLARHAQRSGVELVLAHGNSSQALELLKQGLVHVAGSHLSDNLPAIRKLFPPNAVAVFSFAVWEEGIVVARGDPKSIRDIASLARRGIRLVNREPGSGSRILLDMRLRDAGIPVSKIAGYKKIALGHLPAAWQVRAGEADCCIATRAAARVFGLDFLPLASASYDLAIRRTHLGLPAVQMLLDALARSAFRRELETLGGYDAAGAGRRIA